MESGAEVQRISAAGRSRVSQIHVGQTSHRTAPPPALHGPQDEDVEVSVQLRGDGRVRRDPPVLGDLPDLPPVKQN